MMHGEYSIKTCWHSIQNILSKTRIMTYKSHQI